MIGFNSELSSHARREVDPKTQDLPFLAHLPDIQDLHGIRTDPNGWSKLFAAERAQDCDVKMIGFNSELSSHAPREEPKTRDLPFLAHFPDVPDLHGSRTDTNGWSKLFAAERA